MVHDLGRLRRASLRAHRYRRPRETRREYVIKERITWRSDRVTIARVEVFPVLRDGVLDWVVIP